MINLSNRILPNTSIIVKRFDMLNRHGEYTIGSAISTAMEIANEHPDVVAVFGELFGEITSYSAQVYGHYKLPFCGSSQVSAKLLNRVKYPYYFQARSISGYGDTLGLLLQSWGVSRVALVSSTSVSDITSNCHAFMDVAEKYGIEIVAAISFANGNNVDQIARTLSSVDARYIILCLGQSTTAAVYYSLAYSTIPRLVGPEYVYISQNIPVPYSTADAIAKWGPDYQKAAKGIIIIQPSNLETDYSKGLQNFLIKQVNVLQDPWTQNKLTAKAIQAMGSFSALDCVGILAKGLDNLIRNTSVAQLNSGDLRDSLNWTLFRNTGYRGISDPSKLTLNGDISSAYLIGSVSEKMTYTWFSFTNPDITQLTPLVNRTVTFFSNGSVPPLDRTVFNIIEITRSDALGKFILALFEIGVILSSIFAVLVIAVRKRPLVKSSNAIFLVASICGCAFSYSSDLFYFDAISIPKYTTRVWLQGTAFSIIIGSQITRNARVHLVYQSKHRLQKHILGDPLWLGLLFLIVLFEGAFLTLWSFYSNPHIHATTILSSEKTIMYACTERNASIRYTLYGYNFLLYLTHMGITIVSRNVPAIHSEFTLLLVTNALVALGGIISIALSSSSHSSSSAKNTTISIDPLLDFKIACIGWMITTLILLLQMLPIILDVIFNTQAKAQEVLKAWKVTSSGSAKTNTSKSSKFFNKSLSSLNKSAENGVDKINKGSNGNNSSSNNNSANSLATQFSKVARARVKSESLVSDKKGPSFWQLVNKKEISEPMVNSQLKASSLTDAELHTMAQKYDIIRSIRLTAAPASMPRAINHKEFVIRRKVKSYFVVVAKESWTGFSSWRHGIILVDQLAAGPEKSRFLLFIPTNKEGLFQSETVAMRLHDSPHVKHMGNCGVSLNMRRGALRVDFLDPLEIKDFTTALCR
ncbi:periplasmic binding protein-like I [Obelidium mucronatum]|nr:periplasmic binding protein-like I [Obelidium mucronatum]